MDQQFVPLLLHQRLLALRQQNRILGDYLNE